MSLRHAWRAGRPVRGVVVCAALAGCAASGPATSYGPGADMPGPAAAAEVHPAAPAVPRDTRSHGNFQSLTGINGDAVAAVSIGGALNYVWLDPVAADPQAVAAAPARICAARGSVVKDTYMTRPKDNTPGIKVLVVECLT